MLEDILVLDLTRHLPGPYATQLLADFGADVIKIEAPPTGDPVRVLPPHDDDGLSAAFAALNQGKRSLAIDFKHPEGMELLLALAEKADVLVEGFRPGVLERLGAGPDVLAERNPRLIVCSLSGYGQNGPYRERAGHDIDYQAYAGALHLTPGLYRAPALPGFQIGDMLGSLSAVTGILAALLARERGKEARRVDASILDALVSTQALHLIPHLRGQPAQPGGMPLSGAFPCYGVYATAADGAVALGALEPKFWAVFCDITGRDEWVGRQFDPSLIPEVRALFATRGRDEWRLILEESGCCLAPVLSYDEVVADPQVLARDLVQPEVGRLAPPVRFDPPQPEAAGAPTQVGQHSREVLQELLGLDAAELDRLTKAGALGGE